MIRTLYRQTKLFAFGMLPVQGDDEGAALEAERSVPNRLGATAQGPDSNRGRRCCAKAGVQPRNAAAANNAMMCGAFLTRIRKMMSRCQVESRTKFRVRLSLQAVTPAKHRPMDFRHQNGEAV